MPGKPEKCALCGRVGRPLETIEVGGTQLFACLPHAEMARVRKPASVEELVRACGIGRGSVERRHERRRSEIERRAFWRPTPDRRREETEAGRRTNDA